jgi:predicted DNA-binding protein YlxM (UPF0122 family)
MAARRGEKHKNTLLTDVQVEVIKEMINEGITLREIRLAFNISKAILTQISAGNNWVHIDPKAKTSRKRRDLTRFEQGYAERLN